MRFVRDISGDKICYTASTYYERLGEYLPKPRYVKVSVIDIVINPFLPRFQNGYSDWDSVSDWLTNHFQFLTFGYSGARVLERQKLEIVG